MWVHKGSARLRVEGTEACTSYIFTGPEAALCHIALLFCFQRRRNASLKPESKQVSVCHVCPGCRTPLLLFETETTPVCNFCDRVKTNLGKTSANAVRTLGQTAFGCFGEFRHSLSAYVEIAGGRCGSPLVLQLGMSRWPPWCANLAPGQRGDVGTCETLRR